jgi:voltage-gated sodium channel
MDTQQQLLYVGNPLLRMCSVVFRPYAQHFILGVIFFNALILGMETSSLLMQQAGELLKVLDAICLGIFVMEILMKLAVQRFVFFTSGWNMFDFLVVAISFIPNTGPLAILRTMRILRVLRLVTNLPRLRIIVEAILRSLPSISWIIGLLLVIFYIFSVLTTLLFGSNFPDWFGSIGASMYTLFQVLTLESWSMGIVRPVMEQFTHAYLIFIPFILLTSFIVLNVFIAIIVNAMNEAAEMTKEMKASSDIDETLAVEISLEESLALIKEQIAKLETLLAISDKKADKQ